MKHNIKFITTLACAALLSASCIHFLDEVNPTGLSNVVGTKEMLETDINGMYLTKMIYDANYFLPQWSAAGFGRRGNTGNTYMTDLTYTSCLKYAVNRANPGAKFGYRNQYENVSKANNMLYLLSISPVEESYKRELEGEARFLRGVGYLWIVRNFGDAPLFAEMPNQDNASYAPREHFSKLYIQSVRDLEFAEQNMRSPKRVREVTPTQARPNKFAATAHLTTAYVTIGSLLAHPDDNFWDNSKPGRTPDFSEIGINSAEDAYKKALECAKRIIPGSEEFDPECEYRLLDKYGDLFNFDYEADFSGKGYDPWIHPEQVFVFSNTIVSSLTIGLGNGTCPNFCPDTDNALIDNSSKTGILRPTRFIWDKWCSTYPGERGSSVTTAAIWQSSSDPRVDVTFWHGHLLLGNNTKLTFYPEVNKADKNSSMPYLRKYWSRRNSGNKSEATFYYMRYAEVLLNAAEAAAFLGNEPLARQYIEVIHARARHSVPDGMPDSSQPSWDGRTFSSKEELMVAIFWERMFEIQGEGKEFMETHRFGSTWLSENIAKPENDFYMLPEQKDLFGKYFSGSQRRIYEEDPSELRKSLLMPIPQDEINNNAAIPSDENDFWWNM